MANHKETWNAADVRCPFFMGERAGKRDIVCEGRLRRVRAVRLPGRADRVQLRPGARQENTAGAGGRGQGRGGKAMAQDRGREAGVHVHACGFRLP